MSDDITETSQTVAAGQLRAFIERIERVEAEIKDLNADKSEIYAEMRGVGFDVKAVRKCVAARKLDSAEREEQDAIFDLYWSALGGASRVHVHEGRSSATKQTGAKRATETPASEPSQASDTAGATPSAPATPVPPDRATPGEAGPPSKPNPEDARAKNDEVASLVVGQRHAGGNSGQADIIPDDDVPAFLLKDRPPLRPLCLNPSQCAGYGTKTCHRCLTAAGRSEVAA